MPLSPINPNPIDVPTPINYSELKDERQAAAELLSQYVTPALLGHLVAAEVAMYELANHFADGNNAERWALSGLIHDLDWDATGKDASRHCGPETKELLTTHGIPEEIVDDAFSHYGFVLIDGEKIGFGDQGTQIEADTTQRKALFAADELTGFINACALVRPSKSIEDLEVKSVMKKLKDKSFAAQVDRNLIKTCEQTLNVELREFVELVLNAMKKYRESLER